MNIFSPSEYGRIHIERYQYDRYAAYFSFPLPLHCIRYSPAIDSPDYDRRAMVIINVMTIIRRSNESPRYMDQQLAFSIEGKDLSSTPFAIPIWVTSQFDERTIHKMVDTGDIELPIHSYTTDSNGMGSSKLRDIMGERFWKLLNILKEAQRVTNQRERDVLRGVYGAMFIATSYFTDKGTFDYVLRMYRERSSSNRMPRFIYNPYTPGESFWPAKTLGSGTKGSAGLMI